MSPHGWWRCRKSDGVLVGKEGKACTLESADEVVLEAQKGLEAQSAMADVSLAAMLGVTAADHERISKSYPDRLRVWA